MIKKPQALKAKKGLTLVELVVVIAIIGVLAAILVPTMLGVVQDSRITSANTLASNIKNRVTEFFSKMDTIKASYVGGAKTLTVTAAQNASGGSDWTVAGGAAADWLDGNNHYGAAAVNTTSIATRDTELAAYIADTLTDMKQCTATVYIGADGKVIGVAAIEGAAAVPAGATMPAVTDFTAGHMTWAGNKSGLAANSVIIGTAPTIAHQ